ncbi:universal stress protein [Bradyrhizobium cenepequi]|uniref:universal stress protein n=1 Tax=Bradyrhizobium cenepequi TaxID=2821403 RepID=UPI001CE39D0D|nr:universal stress protein [Bradyrhizobium cenepequi]MCA6110418.1 universal stress protein [Bradyrhizobium cenepequi]
MAYKDLLLALASYPETTPPSAIDLATDFAAAIGAKISAIACEIRVAVPGSFLSPALFDVPAVAASDEKKSRLQAEASLAAFQAAAERRGVFEECILERCMTSEQRELLVDYARVRDLTMIPVQENALFGAWNAEPLIFESGRPVLLLPQTSRKPFALDTATVAWDFSRPAARAVADALPLLTRAKRVHIVTVTNEKRIDTKRSGPELAKHLARHGVEVILDTVDAAGRTVAHALEAALTSHDSDLLVMGAFGHSRFRQFVLGGATLSMISHPPLPVLLSH